ncbi:hypothetical protein E4T38_02041 [Aureobasidium subglaciale]|nr:hypothetical protein E4T38_02041 [Aureobasidium subglaciale]KAI5228924.1 hypothetical protein E4T40_01853 [Aureobasidium subglaciale]KAI5232696.1 hypothetical protein E4T41_02073 [Aureobasidium subglaciale]KAI5266090.1 hypothetical protein E4T46_01818 [Aureobasidium subglaciale]
MFPWLVVHWIGILAIFWASIHEAQYRRNRGTIDRYHAPEEPPVAHHLEVFASLTQDPTHELTPGANLATTWVPLPTVTLTETVTHAYHSRPQINHQSLDIYNAEKNKNSFHSEAISFLWVEFLDTSVGRTLTWVVSHIWHNPIIQNIAYIARWNPLTRALEWLVGYVFYIWSLMPWTTGSDSAVFDVLCFTIALSYCVLGASWAYRLLIRYLSEKLDPPNRPPPSSAGGPPNGGGGGGNPPSEPPGPPPEAGPSGPQAPQGDNQAAQKEIGDLRRKLAEVTQNSEKLQEELAEAKKQKEAAHKQSEELKVELAKVKKDEQAAQTKVGELRDRLSNAQDTTTARDKAITGLNETIALRDDTIQDLQTKNMGLQFDRDITQTKLNKSDTTLDQTKKQHAEAEKRCKATIERLNARIESLKSERDKAATGRDAAEISRNQDDHAAAIEQLEADHKKEIERLQAERNSEPAPVHPEERQRLESALTQAREAQAASETQLKNHQEVFEKEVNAAVTQASAKRDQELDFLKRDMATMQGNHRTRVIDLEKQLAAASVSAPATVPSPTSARSDSAYVNSLLKQLKEKTKQEEAATKEKKKLEITLRGKVEQERAAAEEKKKLKTDAEVLLQRSNDLKLKTPERNSGQDLVDAQASSTVLTTDNADLKKQLLEQQQRIQQIEATARAEVQSREEQITALRTANDESNDIFLQQQTDAHATRETLQRDLNEARTRLEQTINQARIADSDQRRTIEDLEEQSTDIQGAAENLRERIRVLDTERTEALELIEKYRTQGTAHVEGQDKKISELQGQIDVLQHIISSNNNETALRMSTAEGQYNALKAENEELRNNVQASRENKPPAATEQAVEDCRKQLEEEKAKSQKLQATMITAEKNYKSQSAEYSKKQDEVSNLKELLKKSQRPRAPLALPSPRKPQDVDTDIGDSSRPSAEAHAQALKKIQELQNEWNIARSGAMNSSNVPLAAIMEQNERMEKDFETEDQLKDCKNKVARLKRDIDSIMNEKLEISDESHSFKVKVDNLENELDFKDQRATELEGEVGALQAEIDRLRQVNTGLIDTNTNLAASNLQLQWDEEARKNNANVQPTDENNQPPAPTPFSNAPALPPPADVSLPESSSPADRRDSDMNDAPEIPVRLSAAELARRPIRPLRSRSPGKDSNVRGGSRSPTHAPRAPSPLRQIFDLNSSRPPSPNVFAPMQDTNPPGNFNFGGGALNNAPSFCPPGSNAPSSPFSEIVSSAPKTRDEERVEAAARHAEELRQHSAALDEADHQARLEQGARWTEELQQGQQEYEAAGRRIAHADRLVAAGPPEDTEMDTGDVVQATPPRNLVEGSVEEIALLRSLPENGGGLCDQMYRDHNYQLPDSFDEYGDPQWY